MRHAMTLILVTLAGLMALSLLFAWGNYRFHKVMRKRRDADYAAQLDRELAEILAGGV